MGNCTVHLFGSNIVADVLTESKLATALASRLHAVSTTFSALATWEDAYVQDIQGNREDALTLYDKSITKAIDARSCWKAVDFSLANVITHLMSLPVAIAVRPEVQTAYENLDTQAILSEYQEKGLIARFLDINQFNNALNFGMSALKLSSTHTFATDDSTGHGKIIQLFELDQKMVRGLKVQLHKIVETLEELRVDAVKGQMFENMNYHYHVMKDDYPLKTVTAISREMMITNLTYIEMYGVLVNAALMKTEGDDNWPEIKAYLGKS